MNDPPGKIPASAVKIPISGVSQFRGSLLISLLVTPLQTITFYWRSPEFWRFSSSPLPRGLMHAHSDETPCIGICSRAATSGVWDIDCFQDLIWKMRKCGHFMGFLYFSAVCQREAIAYQTCWELIVCIVLVPLIHPNFFLFGSSFAIHIPIVILDGLNL